MTADQFLTWSENYYGKYNPVVKEELRTWLSEKKPYYVAGLRIYVRDHFSTKWGKPPDVAICIEFHTHACQEIYDNGYKLIAADSQKRITELAKGEE